MQASLMPVMAQSLEENRCKKLKVYSPAINPARDLGPRIAHYILPVKNKGKSDWGYAWIPVAGPVAGALLAGLAYQLVR